MPSDIGNINSVKGGKLYCQAYDAHDSQGVVTLIHGYGEHNGRYAHVVKFLNDNGFSVVVYDHYGHGKSPGLQAYVDSMDDLVADLETVSSTVKSKYPNTPHFLLAHSMGAGISILHCIETKLDYAGVVLIGPPVQVPADVSPILQKLSHILAGVIPKIPLADAGGSGVLSTDPVVEAEFDNDPLCYHGKVRVRTGSQILKASKWIQERVGRFKHNVILLHGGEDKLADIDASRSFIEDISSSDKEFVPYEGLYHELLNEKRKEEIMLRILDWMKKRI